MRLELHDGLREWILARGWNHTRWPGASFPSEASLTKAIPDHPVFAKRVDGHAAALQGAQRPVTVTRRWSC